MITLALDTATNRCTVAASNGTATAERHVDGARRHAASVLQLIDEVLVEIGASARHIDRVLTADGPGSFTGLRVSASVAKALAWRRDVAWYTAPSLLLRAVAHCPPEGAKMLALSDALRGEVYAGCWQIAPQSGVTPVLGNARAMRPADLVRFGKVDVVVGTVPELLLDLVEEATHHSLIGGHWALPDARAFFSLLELNGATTLVTDPVHWEPDYGRPAEAQAVWERKHGRSLPDTPVIPR